MFGRIDRYLARSFFEPFLVAAAVIVGLYLVAELFSNIDNYLHQSQSLLQALGRMAQVYLLRIPSYLAPVLPMAMLIGAAYGVAQLSGRNEITAMKASGMSFWRILMPVYGMTVLLSLAAFANRELLVPRVEHMTAANEQQWTGRQNEYQRVVGYLASEGTLYIMEYSIGEREAHKVEIYRDLPGKRPEVIRAERAVPVSGGWLLTERKEPSAPGISHLWMTSLKPRDLAAQTVKEDMLDLGVIRRLIRKAQEENNENNLRRFSLYYHARLAYPFTGLVLVGLGVPFVIGHERFQRSRIQGIGICLLICMVFYLVQFISSDLGFTGAMPPVLAAWLPHVIFTGLGLYILDSVHG